MKPSPIMLLSLRSFSKEQVEHDESQQAMAEEMSDNVDKVVVNTK